MLDERDLLDDALRFLPSQFSRDEVTLAMVENVALEVDTKGTSDPVGTGGSVFVTNLRILWVPATGGSGRAVQLQCVTGCKLKSLLGLNILGTTRVRVSVAVSAAGAQVPASSGSPEERKVWLAAKSGADRIHQSIIQAIRERAWERVAPERDAREGAASTSTGPSRVDSGHLKQLVSMGFPENQARDALAHLPGRPLHDIVDMLLSGWRPASRPSAHVSEPPTSTSASASANASVGVARIRRREQEKQAVQSQLMDAALTDLGALMDRAAEVVKLSEELARQMRSLSGAPASEDAELMRRVVVDMGIASPVTRDVARGGFERELCKEIAVFLMGKPGEQGLLSQFGGMVPMTDVWYYLNRARSAELVAPDEVVAACSLFEEVGAPLSISKLPSSTSVIHATQSSPAAVQQRIVSMLSPPADQPAVSGTGLTAAQVAQSLGVPVALAAELMEGAERSGHLCRDEGGTGGLVFYANAFPTLRYKRGQGAAVLAKS